MRGRAVGAERDYLPSGIQCLLYSVAYQIKVRQLAWKCDGSDEMKHGDGWGGKSVTACVGASVESVGECCSTSFH